MSDFEWCTDCKEYDHNKHCCPRWTKVIRTTLNDNINAVLDDIKEDIEQEIAYKPMEMWDYRMGMARALEIIDKYKEGEDKK